MDDEFNQLIAQLSGALRDGSLDSVADTISDELGKNPHAFEAVRAILELMESNPDFDFGRPGALVHYVEKYYRNGYEDELLASLARRPTQHTVWMLNRLINGSEGESKRRYLRVLDGITLDRSLDASVLSLAEHFKSLHG
jgi:hypothetical protein